MAQSHIVDDLKSLLKPSRKPRGKRIAEAMRPSGPYRYFSTIKALGNRLKRFSKTGDY